MLLCVSMASNLAIDDSLLNEAKKIGHFRTKKETVNSALQEFIERRKQLLILELENSIDYDKNYSYKNQRNR